MVGLIERCRISSDYKKGNLSVREKWMFRYSESCKTLLDNPERDINDVRGFKKDAQGNETDEPIYWQDELIKKLICKLSKSLQGYSGKHREYFESEIEELYYEKCQTTQHTAELAR